MIANLEALSEREKETLRLLLEGHDAKSIARNLGLSVHTVNERLRASRRKLEVSSSREAARLLAQSEQPTPKSVVDKQIGVAGDAVDVNEDRRRDGRKGVEHPIVLAIGGTLIMSLIIATAMLAWLGPGDAEPGPLPNWSTARAVPQHLARPRNFIRLDGNRLLWNGEELSEATIRQYLDLTTLVTPQPLVILSYTAQTPPERVRRARLLIEEVIRCEPSECLEITISPT
jgi:DNA-binding CsgD family transcriptional regulator